MANTSGEYIKNKYVEGCKYVRNTRTNKVFLNHGRFIKREYVVPYFGKIDKAGNAVGVTEDVLLSLKKVQDAVEQQASASEDAAALLKNMTDEIDTGGAAEEVAPQPEAPAPAEAVPAPVEEAPEAPAPVEPAPEGRHIKVGIDDGVNVKEKVSAKGAEAPAPEVNPSEEGVPAEAPVPTEEAPEDTAPEEKK